MLGPRACSELTWSACGGGISLPRACGSGCGPAIEDGLAALQSGSACRCSWRNNGCFVHWPGSRLRHHHAPRSRRDRLRGTRWSSCRLGSDRGNRARSFGWRHNRLSGARRCGGWLSDSGWRGSRLNGSRRRSSRRFHLNLLFTRSRGRGRFHGCASRRRRDNYNLPRGSRCTSRSFCHHGSGGRTRGDSRSGRRRCNDRRRGARLRNDLARPGAGRRGDRGHGGDWGGRRRSRGRGGWLGRGRRSSLHGHARVPRLLFLFLLFRQDSFQHIAGLFDMGEIDLGDDVLRGMARRRGARMRAVLRLLLKMRANLVSLVSLD